MNTYGSKDPKPLELAKNSPEILTGVAMEFRMFCKRKYWSALGRLSAFSKKGNNSPQKSYIVRRN